MKGLINILELMLAGTTLVISFLHFFPQYSIETEWDDTLLALKVRDTLISIDRLNKTYELATDTEEFNDFMENLFSPELTGSPMVWWKKTEDLDGYVEEMTTPYFVRAQSESIIDVINTSSGYDVYTLTLGLGYPY